MLQLPAMLRTHSTRGRQNTSRAPAAQARAAANERAIAARTSAISCHEQDDPSACVNLRASPVSSVAVYVPPTIQSRRAESAGSSATHSSTVFTSRAMPYWRTSSAACAASSKPSRSV